MRARASLIRSSGGEGHLGGAVLRPRPSARPPASSVVREIFVHSRIFVQSRKSRMRAIKARVVDVNRTRPRSLPDESESTNRRLLEMPIFSAIRDGQKCLLRRIYEVCIMLPVLSWHLGLSQSHKMIRCRWPPREFPSCYKNLG